MGNLVVVSKRLLILGALLGLGCGTKPVTTTVIGSQADGGVTTVRDGGSPFPPGGIDPMKPPMVQCPSTAPSPRKAAGDACTCDIECTTGTCQGGSVAQAWPAPTRSRSGWPARTRSNVSPASATMASAATSPAPAPVCPAISRSRWANARRFRPVPRTSTASAARTPRSHAGRAVIVTARAAAPNTPLVRSASSPAAKAKRTSSPPVSATAKASA